MFFPTYLEIRRTQILAELNEFHEKFLSELGEVDKETLAKLRDLVSDYYSAKENLALQAEGVEKLTADAIAKYQKDLQEVENKFVENLNEIKNYVIERATDCQVPIIGENDDGKIMQVVNGVWKAVTLDLEVGDKLPEISRNDNGKVLSALDGKWVAAVPEKELPVLIESDNGKVLGAVGTAWMPVKPPSGLPAVSADDNGKILGVEKGAWTPKIPAKELPTVTKLDDGKNLTVESGMWVARTPKTVTGLPDVTVSDNGKVLGVVDGKWVTTETADGEIPLFDLIALGLPVVPHTGVPVTLQTDTADIETALERGAVRFKVNTDSMRVNLVMSADKTDDENAGSGYVCTTVQNDGGKIVMIRIVVSDGLIVAVVDNVDELPTVSATDNGKVLGVVDGTWSATTAPSVKELPDVSETDNGKNLTVEGGVWVARTPKTVTTLPDVTESDNGKVLGVDGGKWVATTPEKQAQLPTVSETDNGKVLGVSGGAWAAITPVSGGVASWNTLTDRPFGDNEDGTVTQLDNKYLSILSRTGGWGALLPQDTMETFFNDVWGAYTLAFQTTQDVYDKWVANTSAIRVKYDGKTYTATPQVLDSLTVVGNCVGFGGTGNGEPFVLGIIVQLTDGQFSYYWLVGALTDTSPTEHTVSVSMFDDTIYTVNEDNLPMDAIKTVVDDYINEALGGDY